jgi:O-methyltransferase
VSLIEEKKLQEMITMAGKAPLGGIFVEVGVYQGGSAVKLVELTNKRNTELWLFDTFSGMPESTVGLDYHRVGDFSDCSVASVSKLIPDAKIHIGKFPDTWLPTMNDVKISFAHVDVDQYESTRKCIEVLSPLMVDGGIMWFDDYEFDHLLGAKTAVDESISNLKRHPDGYAYCVFGGKDAK